MPEVKRLLNKDWKLDKKSKMGAGMFDDWDDDEDEDKVESSEEENETIKVNEIELLQHIVEDLINSGHTSTA